MDNDYSNLLSSHNALMRALTDLRQMPRRAKVRQLLPLIHQLATLGFPVTDLASILTDADVPFTAPTLHAALYRWRKQQRDHLEAQRPKQQSAPNREVPVSGQAADNGSNMLNQPSSASLDTAITKARLREIRNQHIDLDEIKRAARRLNAQPGKGAKEDVPS